MFEVLGCCNSMTANVKAFVFVAEFEIRQLGTNADVKYKSSL
jgi:hypothetical protein